MSETKLPLQLVAWLAIFGVIMVIVLTAVFILLFPGSEDAMRLTIFLVLMGFYSLMYVQFKSGIITIINIIMPIPTMLLAVMILSTWHLDIVTTLIRLAIAAAIALFGVGPTMIIFMNRTV